MKWYMNYTGEDLVNYVISSPNKNEILKDKAFRNYLLENNNHYPFVWLVQGLSSSDVKILLDISFLEQIIDTNSRSVDKYNAIITSHNEILLNANNKILNYIIDTRTLYSYFSNFNFEVASKFLNYIIENGSYMIHIFSSFNDKIQGDLLTPDIIEKLINEKKFDNVFLNLSPQAIKRLLGYEKYKELLRNLSPFELIKFTEKIKNISVQDLFLSEITLFLNIASLENPSYYRNIINNLLENNYEIVEKIENYRNMYVKKQFELVDEKGIFLSNISIRDAIMKNGITTGMNDKIHPKFYITSINKLDDDFLISITKERKFEMLCDSYFKDYAKNVLYNIKEIVKFNASENIISQDMIDLYTKFLKFNELSDDQIDELAKKVGDKDYAKLLYEDYKKCETVSFELYNKEFLKVDESPNLYNKEFSDKYGLDVYYLDGQDFFACVHSGSFNKESMFHKTISLSFIGTENVGVYHSENLILGFDKISSDRIMHVFNSDSFSLKQFGTRRVNHIYKPHEFLKETIGYNEILYSEKGGSDLSVSYIVCMDEINDASYKYAKTHNLPIVIINTKKYKINNGIFNEESYQEYYETESSDYFGKK